MKSVPQYIFICEPEHDKLRSQAISVKNVGSKLDIAQQTIAARDVIIVNKEAEIFSEIHKSETAVVGWDKVQCVQRVLWFDQRRSIG